MSFGLNRAELIGRLLVWPTAPILSLVTYRYYDIILNVSSGVAFLQTTVNT